MTPYAALPTQTFVGTVSATHTQIVAAPGVGKKIVVVGWHANSDNSVDFSFEQDPTGTPVTISPGLMVITAGSPSLQDHASANESHLYECAENKSLGLNPGGAPLYISVRYKIVRVY